MEQNSVVWIQHGTDHIFFVHSSADGHLGCLHFLAVANNAAMNVGEQIFLHYPDFNSFGYTPRNPMSGSSGRFYL